MNTSRKGTAYERGARKRLEAKGWTVLRSAASKGPYDLVAWKNERLAWIQLKDDGRECDSTDNYVQRLPDVPYGEILLIHRCRNTCRKQDYKQETYCIHVRGTTSYGLAYGVLERAEG